MEYVTEYGIENLRQFLASKIKRLTLDVDTFAVVLEILAIRFIEDQSKNLHWHEPPGLISFRLFNRYYEQQIAVIEPVFDRSGLVQLLRFDGSRGYSGAILFFDFKKFVEKHDPNELTLNALRRRINARLNKPPVKTGDRLLARCRQ